MIIIMIVMMAANASTMLMMMMMMWTPTRLLGKRVFSVMCSECGWSHEFLIHYSQIWQRSPPTTTSPSPCVSHNRGQFSSYALVRISEYPDLVSCLNRAELYSSLLTVVSGDAVYFASSKINQTSNCVRERSRNILTIAIIKVTNIFDRFNPTVSFALQLSRVY